MPTSATTPTPTGSDSCSDRTAWRAAEVRKLRNPAVRCAGGRRIVRRVPKRAVADENDTWDGAAAQSCLGMMETQVFGADAVTVTQAADEPVALGNSARANFAKEHAPRRTHSKQNRGPKVDGRRSQFRGRRDLCGAPNPNRGVRS